MPNTEVTGASDPNQEPRPSVLSCRTNGPVSFSQFITLRGFVAVSKVHKTSTWSKGKAFLGLLGPVQRARVSELWGGDDVDQPPNPSQRVSQQHSTIVMHLLYNINLSFVVLCVFRQRKEELVAPKISFGR